MNIKTKYVEIITRWDCVTVLENVFADKIMCSLRACIYEAAACVNTHINWEKNYSTLALMLMKNGCDLGLYIKKLLAEDENIYIKLKSQNAEISPFIEQALKNDLDLLTKITTLTCKDLSFGETDNIPQFAVTHIDFASEYKTKIERLSKDGYGIYSKYHMFKVGENGEILPVKSADTQSIDDLIGYEKERGKVIANTKALLCGKPAANMLLYGAAGTGKSSTVKATANLLKGDGIRLVEIKKEQLHLLPIVMEEISDNPLKFIIFIDDLTFSSDEQGFGTLKAILEGSASAKAKNAVIYATSNRRHMVKETFSAREGDEIHRNDTIAEQTSLSERFGQTVLFDKPNKFQYLAIVEALATKAGIEYSEEIGTKAEAFAMRKSGRSARCARQFVDGLIAEL